MCSLHPAQIPLNISIRERADQGAPVVAAEPDSPSALAYVSLARRVHEKLLQQAAKVAAAGAGGPTIVVE